MSADRVPPPPLTALTMTIDKAKAIAVVALNRPSALNAIDIRMWRELKSVFEWLGGHPDVRCILLHGAGRHFCAGIDLTTFSGPPFAADITIDPARRGLALRKELVCMQDACGSPEACRLPVVAAVHGACIGAGLELISATDVRLCSADASFALREVDVGIVTDLGGLHRLPHIIGTSRTMELALTARDVSGTEAASIGLVAECVKGTGLSAVLERGHAIAAEIASKSPVAIVGAKSVVLQQRGRPVHDGLQFVSALAGSSLQTVDIGLAIKAQRSKAVASFASLL